MSKHAKPAPKHRAAPERPLAQAPKKALKTTVMLSAIAVGGTGTTVAGGLALASGPTLAGAAEIAAPVAHQTSSTSDSQTEVASGPGAVAAAQPAAASDVRRSVVISRSDRRDAVDPAKAAALTSSTGTAARAVVETEDITDNGDPKSIASALLGSFGWSGDQFGCLVSLWNKESGWRVNAANPSGAYGIPQSLPGSKMASAGPDWQTNAETQIKWGLGYIRDRYGSPCGAWGHSQSYNWY